MKIWAHRGCSQRYPENTMLAFEKAAELKGLTGIELDIQLTSFVCCISNSIPVRPFSSAAFSKATIVFSGHL